MSITNNVHAQTHGIRPFRTHYDYYLNVRVYSSFGLHVWTAVFHRLFDS